MIMLANVRPKVPWIPEPSTVNSKLKRREGSGIQGRPKGEPTETPSICL
jgi:hypothetical protein